MTVHLEIKQASEVKVQRSSYINCLLEYFVFELQVFHVFYFFLLKETHNHFQT